MMAMMATMVIGVAIKVTATKWQNDSKVVRVAVSTQKLTPSFQSTSL
jgi:hypothetical protein